MTAQNVGFILEGLAETPYKLNNLFERDDGQWQANLRYRRESSEHKSPWGSEFGLGPTPFAALQAALTKVELQFT